MTNQAKRGIQVPNKQSTTREEFMKWAREVKARGGLQVRDLRKTFDLAIRYTHEIGQDALLDKGLEMMIRTEHGSKHIQIKKIASR
jgi:hypothetical protein